jgi:hypothetical protein
MADMPVIVRHQVQPDAIVSAAGCSIDEHLEPTMNRPELAKPPRERKVSRWTRL